MARLTRDGSLIWATRLNSPDEHNSKAITETSDGGLAIGITGDTSLPRGTEMVLAKFSVTGVFEWAKEIGTVEDDRFADII